MKIAQTLKVREVHGVFFNLPPCMCIMCIMCITCPKSTRCGFPWHLAIPTVATAMSVEVQSLAINALTKRIQEEAKVLPVAWCNVELRDFPIFPHISLPLVFLGVQDGILRVADFLNYRVDPVLMDNCGAILANKLSKRKLTKVLAGCSSFLAKQLGVDRFDSCQR